MQNKKEDSKMDKTGRDGGCSTSERRLWGGLHNPTIRTMVRNGKASPSSESAPKRQRNVDDNELRYRLRSLAKLESLVYYFEEDWFDLESVWASKKIDGKERAKTAPQPQRCGSCGKPWSTDGGAYGDDKFYYLDGEHFENIPMESGDCHLCQK